ncbi:isocitrate lyase/PEP mutase family protein [Labrys monachus]|uniref:2-methylisocitrate lyase-like PEP mutase family enzyme n=1 Tax=Labrys monachus TaxID=217067 RepID=A0ABU0F8B3_9HYPH|nr:isocitrate lyase/phosphoenolpyruvate mutase family protein [Labrys monachus]MDQ0390852.1 2-methylisocitrate lyase-like PEP mutase family enzyme [Labrys monachus]
MSQAQRAAEFAELHRREGMFLLPNAWDGGTAKLIASLGFEAIATTSAGLAFALGKVDGEGAVTGEETLSNGAAISAATDLPVNADLENGFGDAPADCRRTILAAMAAGLAGGSIEDATGRADTPIYELGHAVERIAAAAEAARSGAFVLTARCENFLHGRRDLADTIRRLQAYQEAGADVLYAPGLTTIEEIRSLVASVDRPVNVLASVAGQDFAVADLAAVGVKRVSIGGSFARAAFGALRRAALEFRGRGRLTYMADAMTFAELGALFRT